MCICTKQTTGILVSAVLIGHKILNVTNKQEFKEYLKDALYRIIGILIPILVMIVYFTITGIWADFIDYCIKGISTFSNSIPYKRLLESDKNQIKVLSIVAPIALIIGIIHLVVQKIRKKNINQKVLIAISYSVASMIVVYPISDEIHFLLAIFPTLLIITYVIDIILKKIKFRIKKCKFIQSHLKDTTLKKLEVFINEFIKMILILVTIYYSYLSVRTLKDYIKVAGEYKEFNHFNYMIQPEGQTEQIKEVNEYIQNQTKEVYILDSMSAMFNIPMDKYVKNFDMFNKGNIGARGENGIIEDLESKRDIIILIRNENFQRNWQNPEMVRDYVIKNGKKVDEINIYDIYEK